MNILKIVILITLKYIAINNKFNQSIKGKKDMKDKTLIAIWGSGRQGKSTTVSNICKLILTEFPKATSRFINEGKDITVIIIIGKIKIGIESQGDPSSRLPDSLKIFSKDENCDIILCTSRTSGMTVETIDKIAQKFNYNLIWATNLRSSDNQEYLNNYSANQIFEFIKTLF